jgi:ABC-2 type transport system permease protein
MRPLNIFLYEWKHFSCSPFKIVAVLLFIVASIYGLHNGADLYKKQNSEIERLNKKSELEKETIVSYFENGEKGPKNRPWVDNTKPFWAIWNTPTHHYKMPSPAIVYNIGQTEQYGFYKSIKTNSSPYDSDMAKEIANPERIQSGALDFSFVVLFLLPLLLLVLLYNIKGSEAEQGFLPLIFVQTGSKNWWIISRTVFYTILVVLVLLCLLAYGAVLTNISMTDNVIWNIFFWTILYLLLWATIYFLILKSGINTVSNTLQMIGIWLLFAFIIPAAIQQWIAIEKPTNLMIAIIDAKRDKTDNIYAQSDKAIDEQLFELFPSLKQTDMAKDSIRIKRARRNSMEALINIAMKDATSSLEKDNQSKNELISKTYWFNPITFFQNKLNHLSKTHYNDYQEYRNEIQDLVNKRTKIMVLDIWNDVKVDQTKYLEYYKEFSNAE